MSDQFQGGGGARACTLMSLTIVPVADLVRIATNIHDVRTAALVNKYYNDILAATHQGLFTVTFMLNEDDFGDVMDDEWEAIDTIEKLFPGIKSSCDRIESTCTFSWHAVVEK